MRALSLLLFILVLPFLAALGHDLYISYGENQDYMNNIATKEMMFSDVGYLWTTYEPDSYNWVRGDLDEESWKTFVAPFLEQTTVIVTLIPPAILMVIMLLIKFWDNLAVLVKTGGKKKSFKYNDGSNKKAARFNYKRK